MEKFIKFILIILVLFSNVLDASALFSERDKLVNLYVKDAKGKGLSLVIIGGGGINEIRNVDLGFNTIGPISISQARKFVVHEVTELVHRMNAHGSIRPLMHEYPFTSANVTYCIAFVERATGRPCSTGVEMVLSNEGHVMYFDENKGLSRKPPILVETWEEAVALAGQPGLSATR